MIKKTEVEQIEVNLETGIVGVRMVKMTLDGDKEVRREYHRTLLEPDADIDATAKAINDYLIQIGEVPVEESHWTSVKRHVALARTPEVVKKWAAQKEARLAQEKIRQAAEQRRLDEETAKAEKVFRQAVVDALREVATGKETAR